MIGFWMLLAYLMGAMPLSYWLGLVAGIDILAEGDRNPGATNLLRTAGWPWGVAAYMLDFSKAAVPVGLAYVVFGVQGWAVVPIALAPAVGHAWSLFLRGRGGKALATIFGTWIGLTLYEMPSVIIGLLLFWFLLLKTDGWSVVFSAIGMGLYLCFFLPDPVFGAVWAGQFLLVIWTHRSDLKARPAWRDWVNSRA